MYTTRLLVLVVLLGTVTLTGCGGSSATTIDGSGNVKTETREVSGFNQIALTGTGTVIVQQGNTEGLRVEAEDNILPHISSTVTSGRLSIDVSDKNVTLKPSRPISFYITAKQVSALHLSGAGEIRAPNLRTGALEIRIAGAGNVTTDGLQADTQFVGISGKGDFTGAGTADTQHISISGTGNYIAKELRGSRADVSITGLGSATVRVSTSLNAVITGTGTILYVGNPQVQQQISGIGEVAKTA